MRRGVRSFMMPRVHRVRKGDRVLKYHRVTRARLPDGPEDSLEFIEAWRAQEAGKPPEKTRERSGTVAWGCQEYLRSNSFSELSGGYRAIIRRHVDAIRAQGSAAELRHLKPRHIESDLEPLTPSVASARLKAWRKMSAFWKMKGWTDGNLGASAKGKPIPVTDGHKEWTHENLMKFRERWPIGTAQRLACELYQWTGARSVDAIRMGPGMIDGAGLLCFRQQKTGVEVAVPWTAPAFGLEPQRRDLMTCLESHDAMVFILTKYGKARSLKAVTQWFSDACTKANLPDLSAHGLRKYRMNQLAEIGAPLLAMQAWVGHATLKEVERYTRRAARRNVFFVNQTLLVTKTTDK